MFSEIPYLSHLHYQFRVGSSTYGQRDSYLPPEIEQVLLPEKPDVVLVQDNPNTVLAGGLAALKFWGAITMLQIKIYHEITD